MLPLWWDGRTLVRLLATVLWVAGWLGIALWLAPWVFRKVDEATRGTVQGMVATLDRMSVRVRPGWCLASIVGSAVVCGLVGGWITSGLPPGGASWGIRLGVVGVLVLGPFGLPIGLGLPRYVVRRLWERRIRRFEEQLVDALACLSNGLRSGLSLVQSIGMVVEEFEDPMAEELGLVLAEQRVGVSLEDALLHLEQRIGTEDVAILVTSIHILRQTGGNLSETFETIAHTIRERKKVTGRIRTLTAQGVAQATIITGMPFVLGFVLWTFDPVLVSRLWTTWLGWILIGAMVALQVTGALLMRRMVTIRV